MSIEEPYGPEWKAELIRMRKADIIEILGPGLAEKDAKIAALQSEVQAQYRRIVEGDKLKATLAASIDISGKIMAELRIAVEKCVELNNTLAEREKEIEQLTALSIVQENIPVPALRREIEGLRDALRGTTEFLEDNDEYPMEQHALRVAKAALAGKDTIEDGFGSEWSAWCPMCKKKTMEIVRPGMVQCSECG